MRRTPRSTRPDALLAPSPRYTNRARWIVSALPTRSRSPWRARGVALPQTAPCSCAQVVRNQPRKRRKSICADWGATVAWVRAAVPACFHCNALAAVSAAMRAEFADQRTCAQGRAAQCGLCGRPPPTPPRTTRRSAQRRGGNSVSMYAQATVFGCATRCAPATPCSATHSAPCSWPVATRRRAHQRWRPRRRGGRVVFLAQSFSPLSCPGAKDPQRSSPKRKYRRHGPG